MDDELSFGRWVKVRRVALGLTQSQLAGQTGYSTVTIRKIESDDLRPSSQIAEKLADALALMPAERSDFFLHARGEGGAARQQRQSSSQAISLPSNSTQTASLPPFLTEESPSEFPPPIFVERARELAELATNLETARSGKGQLLFVIGSAGRGKTTLVQEFARRAQQQDPSLLVVSGHCNAHTGIGDPYLPFREMLSALAGDVEAKWASGSLSTDSARRLWEAMPITLPVLVEHARELIGPFVPAKVLQKYAATFSAMGAPWAQQLVKFTDDEPRLPLEEKRLFAQYTALLKAIAAQRPLLLLLEDLHWIDAASSSLLFHLSREIGTSPILLLGTYRPNELAGLRKEGQRDERHPLLDITTELKRQHGDIWLDLANLSGVEGRAFVDAYLDTQPNRLGEAFRAAFFHHTGGHALFTVELLGEMQARGDLCQDDKGDWIEGNIIDWHTLPPKVEGVIEKRIQWLDQGLQELLTVASIEGEIFTAEVVAHVQQGQAHHLVQRLSRELDRQHRLVTAEALNQIGRQRLSRYRFRHYLFQHYLYHRLDITERAYLHEAVGNALESLYGEQVEQVAVQLAHHYEQASITEKAVTYLILAAERAHLLSANQEAIHHVTQALAHLARLPDSPQRARQEVALHIALGHSLAALKGYGALETGEAYNQAYKLALQIEETPQIFAALHGMHSYHSLRAELHTACEVAEQMLELAEDEREPIFRVSAHRALGNNLLFLGEFGAARQQLEQGILLYRRQDHLSYVQLCGQDHDVSCLVNLAWVLWFLGYPDQALQRSQEALAMAQELAHPMTLAMALAYVTALHLSLQEWHEAQLQAEALISLSAEYGFTLRWATGVFCRGFALVSQGEPEALAQLQHGWNTWQAVGAESNKSQILAKFAVRYAKAGQPQLGLNLLVEALAQVEKTDERFWEAELYRLKGEVLLIQDESRENQATTLLAEVERSFHQAIEIARRQRAKSFELRATISLCRLWQTQGRSVEAHALLAEVYGWFTEGFDTVDLIEAKALLYALKS